MEVIINAARDLLKSTVDSEGKKTSASAATTSFSNAAAASASTVAAQQQQQQPQPQNKEEELPWNYKTVTSGVFFSGKEKRKKQLNATKQILQGVAWK